MKLSDVGCGGRGRMAQLTRTVGACLVRPRRIVSKRRADLVPPAGGDVDDVARLLDELDALREGLLEVAVD